MYAHSIVTLLKSALCDSDTLHTSDVQIVIQIGLQPVPSKLKQIRAGIKKNLFLLGKSPKLWVGGGQES